MSWKDLEIEKINTIEKLVAEFEVSALTFFEEVYEGDQIPFGSFKVRIYEQKESNTFIGYTNLKLKDPLGGFDGAVGYGLKIEDALVDIIKNFKNNVCSYMDNCKRKLNKDDFSLVSYDEF